jgi:hypothetical protein
VLVAVEVVRKPHDDAASKPAADDEAAAEVEGDAAARAGGGEAAADGDVAPFLTPMLVEDAAAAGGGEGGSGEAKGDEAQVPRPLSAPAAPLDQHWLRVPPLRDVRGSSGSHLRRRLRLVVKAPDPDAPRRHLKVWLELLVVGMRSLSPGDGGPLGASAVANPRVEFAVKGAVIASTAPSALPAPADANYLERIVVKVSTASRRADIRI